MIGRCPQQPPNSMDSTAEHFPQPLVRLPFSGLAVDFTALEPIALGQKQSVPNTRVAGTIPHPPNISTRSTENQRVNRDFWRANIKSSERMVQPESLRVQRNRSSRIQFCTSSQYSSKVANFSEHVVLCPLMQVIPCTGGPYIPNHPMLGFFKPSCLFHA